MIKLNVKLSLKGEPVVVRLNARKTLDGNILISDHIDIYIMIIDDKVLTYPKEEYNDDVFISQDRLFNFLIKTGIIKIGSVKGGNIYGSIEGLINKSVNKIEPLHAALFGIAKFLESEKHYFETVKDQEKMLHDYWEDPSEEDSTELGEIPQEPKKGDLEGFQTFSKYYYGNV